MPTRMLLHFYIILGFVSPSLLAGSARAEQGSLPAEHAQAQKTVRALVNAIRYNKDTLAAKQLDFDGMARLLLADSYQAASVAQRQAMVADLTTLVTSTSFPKGRDLFGYLDALLFDAVTPVEKTLHVKSVVVVHRNLKKLELPIEWVLAAAGKEWRVVDIISMGESTAQGIREEEVLPLLREGGLDKVAAALHERAAEMRRAAPQRQGNGKGAP